MEAVEGDLHTAGTATVEEVTHGLLREEVMTVVTVQTEETVIIHTTNAISTEHHHTLLRMAAEDQAVPDMGIIVHTRVTIIQEIIIPLEAIHHNMMTEDMQAVEEPSLILM